MFVDHKYHLTERMSPNVLKAASKQIVVKPTLHVPEEHPAAIPAPERKLVHRFRFFSKRMFLPHRIQIFR